MEYLSVSMGLGKVTDFIKSVKDGNNTIYDELGYPREEEKMVEFIKSYRDNLKAQIAGNEELEENRRAKYFMGFIDDALKSYDEKKNFHNLLTVFVDVDIQERISKAKESGINEEDLKALKNKLYLYGSLLKDPKSKEIYDNVIDSFSKREAIDRLARIHVENEYGPDALRPIAGGSTSSVDWSVKLFPKKQLYFDADARFEDMPQLNQNVKVYSHGLFRYGSMVSPSGNHAMVDELSEIISVERTNSLGEKTRDFLIVGDRILGRVEYLSAQQIYEMQNHGVKLLVGSDPKEEEELAMLRHRLMNIRKAMSVHDKDAKVARFTAKIARPLAKMGIVDIEEGKNEFERQEERKAKEKVLLEKIDAIRLKRDEARPCFISDPQRIELSQMQRETLARNIFVGPVIERAIAENGRFMGNMDTRSTKHFLDPRRISPHTRNACIYAKDHPGLVDGKSMTLEQLIAELERRAQIEDSRREDNSAEAR